jgi:hypothetical protein
MTTVPRALTFSMVLLAVTGCAHKSWNEIHVGFAQETSRDCLACHEQARPVVQAHRSHRVDADYAQAAARSNGSLRTPEEVLRRGIALPEGKVGCRSCHSFESPWKDHLALPSGAAARPAVDPRDPRTYEDDSRTGEAVRPQPGAAVSAKPLCETCHAF